MAQSAPLTALHDETALSENVTEFISHFLDTRFRIQKEDGTEEQGLPDGMKAVLFDVCLEMYIAGAQWADNTSGREGKSIILN